MKLESKSHPHNVSLHFGDYLSAQKETILNEWLKQVRQDAAILPTETLSTFALKNHLPQIFDDLIETLLRSGSKIVAEQTETDAMEHGATRMQQGYELTEMLRELKHLRAILIYHLRVFEEKNPGNSVADRLFDSTTLHGFLDEMAMGATDEYLWSKMTLQERIHRGYIRC